MSLSKPIQGFRRAATKVGDTIQDIAVRELGDRDRWYDLVHLNGLVPPYLADNLARAGQGVLLAGQQDIKIPTKAPAPSGVADAESVFGTDVSLAGGQLDVTDGGDLLTVTGSPNLAQALRNRLVTHPGDLAPHPDYGCKVYQLLGQGGTETTNRLAATFVARAVRGDARVSRVEDATATIAGDTVSARATAVTVDGKRVPTGIPNGPAVAPVLPQ